MGNAVPLGADGEPLFVDHQLRCIDLSPWQVLGVGRLVVRRGGVGMDIAQSPGPSYTT